MSLSISKFTFKNHMKLQMLVERALDGKRYLSDPLLIQKQKIRVREKSSKKTHHAKNGFEIVCINFWETKILKI